MKARLLPLVLLLSALPAYADSIRYNIDFVPTSGVPPTHATFLYDHDTPLFTQFLITWGGWTYDFTTLANSLNRNFPQSLTTIRGNVPCVDGLNGAAATFAYLSGACNQPGWTTRWEETQAASDVSVFWIRTFRGPSAEDYIGLTTLGNLTSGTGAIGNSWSIATVPEAGSALLLLVGFAPVLMVVTGLKNAKVVIRRPFPAALRNESERGQFLRRDHHRSWT